MRGIKAIETQYKGYRMRSRLEARWALFFDLLNIDWEYEPEGYDLGEYGWYLPDFYLPQVKMFAEVKPTGGFTPDALEKCKALSLGLKCSILLAEGIPGKTFATNGYSYYNNKTYEFQYELCNFHNYHINEHRFFSNPGWIQEYNYECGTENYIEYINIINKVKSARFERYNHGE